jgi:signal transduction histidine kinase
MTEQKLEYHASDSVSAPGKSIDLIEEKGRELHLILIYLVAAYSVAYCIVNLLIGQTTQAYITAFIVPSVFITWLLNKWGYYYYSKLWNGIQINVIIALLALTTGPETYISAFFIPIIIGTLVTLQGRERTTGYMLSLLSISLMAFTLVTDIRILDVTIANEDSLRAERIANMVGVGIISAMEVIYILRTSNDIQNQLVAQTARLDLRNSQMVSALYTRDKMMSMLSHDLRSPIASIHAGMELFETGTVNADLQAKLYTQMKSRTAQTLDLMDKLLMWSRSQTQSITFREEPISINQIEQFAKSMSYLFSSEKQIQFSFHFDAAPGALVCGDRDMLEAIFRNLMSNAIKFTKTGGTIKISAHELGSSWKFSISDSGKGLNREEIEMIYNGVSFTTSGTQREIGHGLGMQLVQDFIRKHNTFLTIDSTINQGTTFSFELPKA